MVRERCEGQRKGKGGQDGGKIEGRGGGGQHSHCVYELRDSIELQLGVVVAGKDLDPVGDGTLEA